MSPLVPQKRASVVPERPDPTAQPWGMLVFESLSAGVMAIFVGFVVVVIVVGVYVILVWPLTFWDLANLGLERLTSWIRPALWSVFAVGTLVGYWCFGGAAFRTRQNAPASAAPVRPRKQASGGAV